MQRARRNTRRCTWLQLPLAGGEQREASNASTLLLLLGAVHNGLLGQCTGRGRARGVCRDWLSIQAHAQRIVQQRRLLLQVASGIILEVRLLLSCGKGSRRSKRCHGLYHMRWDCSWLCKWQCTRSRSSSWSRSRSRNRSRSCSLWRAVHAHCLTSLHDGRVCGYGRGCGWNCCGIRSPARQLIVVVVVGVAVVIVAIFVAISV